jgi:hypothetical protein
MVVMVVIVLGWYGDLSQNEERGVQEAGVHASLTVAQ